MTNSKSQRGPIEPTTCYSLIDFKRRTGIGDAGLRAARKAGMRIYYVHKRPFVIGADFIEYLKANGSNSQENGKAAE